MMGLIVKVIWALAALSCPLLAITALVMWWNRVFSDKWSKRRSEHEPRAAVSR